MNRHFFKGFIKGFWGVGSLIYIFIIFIIAVFAYKIAPDKTRNGNQMHLSIHSKPPGFKTLILKIPQNYSEAQSSPFFFGSLNTDEEIPLKQYRLTNDGIAYQVYGTTTSIYESVSVTSFPIGTTPREIESKYIEKRVFPLGTDKYGRDLLSRLIIGSRISLSIGFVAVFISLSIGIFLGAIAGYYGGWIDRVIVWLVNVVWSIPTLLMVIAITLALGRGFWQVFIAVGLTMWVEVARLVRGQVKTTKEKLFVQAAESLGFSNFRILWYHIMPSVIAPLIVIAAANFASAILLESGLSFLGIGAQPPMPSWGGMIKDHFRYLLLGKPYLAVLPGLAIMALVLAFMMLGNRLRDALDVKN